MKKKFLIANYIAIIVYLLLHFWIDNVYQTIEQGVFIFCYLFIAGIFIYYFFNQYIINIIKQKQIIWIVFFAILSGLLCIDKVILTFPQNNMINITATGDKNLESNAAEVWITQIKLDENEIPLSGIELENGWFYRAEEDVLVSYPDSQSYTLNLNAGYAEEAEILFIKHDWSGEVKVGVNHKDKAIVDLYSEVGDNYFYELELEGSTNILWILFSFAMIIEIFTFIYGFLFSLYRRKKEVIVLINILYTFIVFGNLSFLEINKIQFFLVSMGQAVIVYFLLLLKIPYSQKKKREYILFFILNSIITFLIFGTRLFLIPSDYSLKTWIIMLGLVIWFFPITVFGISLLDRLEGILKERKGKKKTREDNKKVFKIVICCISILGGLMVGAVFYDMFCYQEKECTILITPSGEKNEYAQGYEVLLSGIYVDGMAYKPEAFGRIPEGWKDVNGIWIGSKTESLVLKIPKAKDIKILFNKHPWSGIVKIEENGKENYIDLFSDGTSYLQTYQVKGNREYYFTNYRIVFILFISIFVIFSMYYILCSVVMVWKEEVIEKKFFVTIFLIEIMIYAVYIIASYPASICIDGRTQLLQVLGVEKMTDAHPAIHTLLLKYLTFNGKFLVLFPIVQMCYLSFVSAMILKFLYGKGMNKKYLLVFGAVSALMVNNGIYTTVIWKDELYSISLLSVTYLLYRMEEDRNYIKKKEVILIGSILLTAVRLFRHNGIVVYMMIFLLFFLWTFLRKNWGYMITLGLSICFIFVIKKPIYNLIGVEGVSNGASLASMIHGVVYASTLDEIPEETKVFLTDIMPLNEWENCYSAYSANELYMSETAYQYQVSQKLEGYGTRKILKEYCRVLFYSPIRLVEDRLFGIDLMWNVFQDNGYDWRVANDSYEIGVVDNTMGWYRHDNIFTNLIKKITQISVENKFLDAIFWRSGIWVCILCILFFYQYFRRKMSWAYYIPVIGNMISLCLAMAWQDFRYVYFINLCVPYLVLMCLVEKKGAKEKNESTCDYSGLQ